MEPIHIALIIAGLGCLSGGAFFLLGWTRYKRSQLWQAVEGTIVDSGAVGADEAVPITFAYRTTYGEEKTVTSRIQQTPAPLPGTAIQVLYNPDQTDEAVIDSFAQRGKFFIVMGVGLFVLDLIAAAAVYALMS